MGCNICNLLFADERIILAEDEDDISYMFSELPKEYGRWEMEIKLKKTHHMVNGIKAPRNENLKTTTKYKYLGITLTVDKKDDRCTK